MKTPAYFLVLLIFCIVPHISFAQADSTRIDSIRTDSTQEAPAEVARGALFLESSGISLTTLSINAEVLLDSSIALKLGITPLENFPPILDINTTLSYLLRIQGFAPIIELGGGFGYQMPWERRYHGYVSESFYARGLLGLRSQPFANRVFFRVAFTPSLMLRKISSLPTMPALMGNAADPDRFELVGILSVGIIGIGFYF